MSTPGRRDDAGMDAPGRSGGGASPAVPADEPRDAHLMAALRHAPDADARPPDALTRTILAQAHRATNARPHAGQRQADHMPPRRWRAAIAAWADRWLQPAPLAAFGTVAMATLIGVMWTGRELPHATPSLRGEPARSTPAPPPAAGAMSRAASPTAASNAESAVAANAPAEQAARGVASTATAEGDTTSAAQPSVAAPPLRDRRVATGSVPSIPGPGDARQAGPLSSDVPRPHANREPVQADRSAAEPVTADSSAHPTPVRPEHARPLPSAREATAKEAPVAAPSVPPAPPLTDAPHAPHAPTAPHVPAPPSAVAAAPTPPVASPRGVADAGMPPPPIASADNTPATTAAAGDPASNLRRAPADARARQSAASPAEGATARPSDPLAPWRSRLASAAADRRPWQLADGRRVVHGELALAWWREFDRATRGRWQPVALDVGASESPPLLRLILDGVVVGSFTLPSSGDAIVWRDAATGQRWQAPITSAQAAGWRADVAAW